MSAMIAWPGKWRGCPDRPLPSGTVVAALGDANASSGRSTGVAERPQSLPRTGSSVELGWLEGCAVGAGLTPHAKEAEHKATTAVALENTRRSAVKAPGDLVSIVSRTMLRPGASAVLRVPGRRAHHSPRADPSSGRTQGAARGYSPSVDDV